MIFLASKSKVFKVSLRRKAEQSTNRKAPINGSIKCSNMLSKAT